MRRYQLFEFEDLSWFPDVIRSGMMDYLRFIIRFLNVYEPVTPLLIKVLKHSNESNIVDLGSGGGGAIEQVHQNLSKQTSQKIEITLTDKYPNIAAWKYIQQKTNGLIGFHAVSVDANHVPADLCGIRTLFSAAHHFWPEQIKSMLKTASNQQKAICLFDGGDKNWFLLLGSIPFHLVVFLFCTPFIRPFKFSRFLFTYLIPLIPLCTIWDGCVSILRLYRPEKLLQLSASTQSSNYTWQAGKVKGKTGLRVTYLVGYPNLNADL